MDPFWTSQFLAPSCHPRRLAALVLTTCALLGCSSENEAARGELGASTSAGASSGTGANSSTAGASSSTSGGGAGSTGTSTGAGLEGQGAAGTGSGSGTTTATTSSSSSSTSTGSSSSSGGDWGYGGSAAGGAGGGSANGSPQSWQQSSDEVLFATVSVGGGQSLTLSRMRVTAYVEGLRARTVVDHIFHNPFSATLEGTFRYPLPPEASVSYFAMFEGIEAPEPTFFGPADSLLDQTPSTVASLTPDAVVASADPTLWPGAKVARVVRSVAATKAYEQEAIQQVDPALIEQVAPNSFEARVFPIPANSSIRLVMAYEQTLPRVGDALEYEFVLPNGAIDGLDVTLAAPKTAVALATYTGAVPDVTDVTSTESFAFTKSFVDASPGGQLAFSIVAANATSEVDLLSGTDPAAGESYFYARLRPDFGDLPLAGGGSPRGVFLVDTSLSEHPDQFNVNLQIMEGILESSPAMTEFGLITFDASARWLGNGWFSNDPSGRAAAQASLGAVLLEGATDFSAALRALASPPWPVGSDNRLDAFVLSDGVVNWGDSSAEAMINGYDSTSPFESRFFVYRTGLAADNLELFRAVTRRGAIFNCFSASSIPGCSTAHQATGVVLSSATAEGVGADGAAVENVLVAGRQATLFAGADLTVAGRVLKGGPALVHLHGKVDGTVVDVDIPVTFESTGTLAPRAWAEIAVGQLVQTRDADLEGVAMALSQRYRVASRLGSFIVLESEQDYIEYDLLDETASFQGQSIADLVTMGFSKLGAGWSSWDRIVSVLSTYADTNKALTLDEGALVPTIEALAEPGDLELPASDLLAPSVATSEAPSTYVDAMTHEPDDLDTYVDEAERRREEGDVGTALRALSSVVENSPSSASVERLVGYRVDSWGESAAAGALFLHVLERRPFEPQSYRDIANNIWTARPGLSAIMFECVLAGTWDAKFNGFTTVAREEYALLISGIATDAPSHPLNPYLAQRKQALALDDPTGDLRVTITWNTNDTDIDLWVTDPAGEKCFYGNTVTASGGQLTDDFTQGYGPERFLAKNAIPGSYVIQVHYYGNNSNLLIANTYVNVAVMTHVGTAEETIERFNVPLDAPNELATVKVVTY